MNYFEESYKRALAASEEIRPGDRVTLRPTRANGQPWGQMPGVVPGQPLIVVRNDGLRIRAKDSDGLVWTIEAGHLERMKKQTEKISRTLMKKAEQLYSVAQQNVSALDLARRQGAVISQAEFDKIWSHYDGQLATLGLKNRLGVIEKKNT
jgi:hypothetical protein